MRLFTYGTLMLPEVMEIVAGSGLRNEPAGLLGYRRGALRGAIYPGLVPEPGVEVRGVLWEGLDARGLARIDRFEGEGYERRTVAVERDASARCEAFVYVTRPAERGLVEAAAWDVADFRTRHLGAYLEGCRAFARGEA